MMNRNAIKRTTLALAVLALILGCSSDPNLPPQIVLDRSACSECGMLVSDVRFASALRLSDGSEQLFDDPACLIRSYESLGSGESARIWVHDHESGEMIEASTASFVLQDKVRGPMGGTAVCAIDRASAETLARALDGRVVPNFNALLNEGRATR